MVLPFYNHDHMSNYDYIYDAYSPEEIAYMRQTGCTESVLKVLRGCLDHEECNCGMTATSLNMAPVSLKRAIDWLEEAGYIEWRSTHENMGHVSLRVTMELCILVSSWDVYANPVYFKTVDICKMLGTDPRVIDSHRRRDVVDSEGQLMNILQLGKVLHMEDVVEEILEEARTTKHLAADIEMYTHGSKPRDYERSEAEILMEGRAEYVLPICRGRIKDPVLMLRLQQLSTSDERLPEDLLQKIRKEFREEIPKRD